MKTNSQQHGVAWRVGFYTLATLALFLLAVVIVVGGRWWKPVDKAIMNFEHSVYGLQTGAPVVFRGVKMGEVKQIGLATLPTTTTPDAGKNQVLIPVTVEIDRSKLQQLLGSDATVPSFVARGGIARLGTQSLLTGQLYVDLDVEPNRSGLAQEGETQSEQGQIIASNLPVIPTKPSPLQALQSQLNSLNLAQLGQEIVETATSLRNVVNAGQIEKVVATVEKIGDAAQALQVTATQLQKQIPPLSRAAQGTLAETKVAANQVSQTAQQWKQTGKTVSDVTQSAQPLINEVQQTLQELTRTATSLRDASSEDSSLRLNANNALRDVSQAARSLRELSDLLEQHPDVILRGRSSRVMPDQPSESQPTTVSTPLIQN